MEIEKKDHSLRWLAPSDRHHSSFDIASLGNKQFDTVAGLLEKCNEHAWASFGGNHQKLSKYAFGINTISYPTQVSVCPTVQVIKDRLFLDNLIISVHSLDGYEFSSEYTHVYKGVYNKLTVYDDLSAVIRRSLRVFDPNMIEVNALKFSDYVMRTAAWESHLAHLVAAETVKTVVPGVDIVTKWKDTEFHHVKVYIGKNETGEMYFTVRMHVQLEVTEPVPKNEAQGAKKTKPVPIPISFVYYRTFQLNKATLDEFEQITFVNPKNNLKKGEKINAVPPPPPSRAKKGSADADDIRLFLMFGKTPEEIAAIVAALEEAKKKEESERAAAAAAEEADGKKSNESVATDTDEDSVRQQKKKLEKVAKPVKASRAADSAVIPTNQSSYCSEVMIWGFNSCNSFGLPYMVGNSEGVAASNGTSGDGNVNKYDQLERVIEPQPITIPYSLAIERISMIACSSNHTLILTHLGTIYSCGDNSEGALGLGDHIGRDALTFLDWPLATYSSPPKISKIAAGCSNIGAHSMAIDVEGRLYGWGVSYAVGRGEVKAITSPALISLLPGGSSSSTATDTDSLTGDEGEPPVISEADRIDQRVVDVSCGGGYTVCVTRSGHVFSWGTWAHGRLGLGPVPMIDQPRTARKRAVKKLARYQLHPRLVAGVNTAVKVVCGEAHTLCLLSCGSLLSWGQNSCGQLGVGPSYTGYLTDSFYPVIVAPFVNHASIEPKYLVQFQMKSACAKYETALDSSRSGEIRAVDIACGAFHSVVKTANGGVYSWGGRGSPCLGHNDQEILGEWSAKINLIFSIATAENKTMVPHELWEWCTMWSLPRLIESLQGIEVQQLACGDLHSTFLASNGRIYLCGSGPVVPGIISTSKILEDNEQRELQQKMVDMAIKEKNKDGSTEGVAAPLSKDTSKLLKGVRLAEQQARLASLVSSPRCPSSCWLLELCTRNIGYVASGACKIFAIVDAECVTSSLTNSLLDRLNSTAGVANNEKDDDMSMASSISDSASKIESIFENRGKADCMVLASGKVFLCHKALLAQRSPELRDMIAMETPMDNSYSEPVQILLPELQRDSARVLLHFLYCDTLPKWCIHNTSLLRTLLRAAQTLRIPRLQLLCERFIKLINATTKVGKNENGDVSRIVSDLSYTSQLDMPPCTLARDLGSMVGDPEFADVRFIAEGRAIVAHRFVLESRCEYFRAMFRSGLGENAVANKGMVDVVVPDSFVGFLRLLLFIYTDSLPDGSDGALLEDLMAADRYDVQDMKVLCENMLVPSQSNWMDLLRAADLLGSRRLHLLVTSYLRDNLTRLSAGSGSMSEKSNAVAVASITEADPLVVELMNEFPEVYDEVMALRRGMTPAPPCALLINQCIANSKGNEAAQKKKDTFPFWALLMAAICLAMYQNLSKYVPLGWVVPIVNVAGVLIFVVIGFKTYQGA